MLLYVHCVVDLRILFVTVFFNIDEYSVMIVTLSSLWIYYKKLQALVLTYWCLYSLSRLHCPSKMHQIVFVLPSARPHWFWQIWCVLYRINFMLRLSLFSTVIAKKALKSRRMKITVAWGRRPVGVLFNKKKGNVSNKQFWSAVVSRKAFAVKTMNELLKVRHVTGIWHQSRISVMLMLKEHADDCLGYLSSATALVPWQSLM